MVSPEHGSAPGDQGKIRSTPKKGSSSGVPDKNCIKKMESGQTLLRRALARRKRAAKGVVPPVKSIAVHHAPTDGVAVQFDPEQLAHKFGTAIAEAGYSEGKISHARSVARLLVSVATNMVGRPPKHVGEVLRRDVLTQWIHEVRSSRSSEHRLSLVVLLLTFLHSGQVISRTLIPECEWVRNVCHARSRSKRRKAYYEVTCDDAKDHPLAQEFIQHLFDLNEHWQKSAKYVFRRLCGWLSQQPEFQGASPVTIDFRQVTSDHLQQYRELEGLVAAQHLSKGTYRLHVQRIKRLFDYLFVQGHIKDDPALRLARVKGREDAPWRLVKPTEVQNLLRAVVLHGDNPLRDLALLGVMSGMGLRASEAVGLTIGDLDRQTATLRVLGKNKKVRPLPIPGPVLLALDRYLASRPEGLPPEAPLWVGQYGHPLPYERLRKLFHAYEAKAGLQRIPFRGPHGFRHYFITVNLLAGEDPEDIAALAGHDNLRAITSYFHTSVEGLRAALLKAFGLLEESA